jgi:hypothetical protein
MAVIREGRDPLKVAREKWNMEQEKVEGEAHRSTPKGWQV